MGKVFHVRPKHHRFTGINRFNRVLSSVRGETFPNKDYCGGAVPIAEFSGGIENQAIGIRKRVSPPAPPYDSQTAAAQLRLYLRYPLDMSRSNYEKKRRKLLP
jgi:hypothetical protein